MSLRNEDMQDRELLFAVDYCTTEDGYASTGEIAEYLGISMNGGKRDLGSRMAWMVRIGYCAKDPEKKAGYYKLTDEGRSLMVGKLTKPVERALEGMREGDRVLVMRSIAGPGFQTRGPAADMLRREYLHHFAHRPDVRARRRGR